MFNSFSSGLIAGEALSDILHVELAKVSRQGSEVDQEHRNASDLTTLCRETGISASFLVRRYIHRKSMQTFLHLD